jgi:hypothetical protein
VKVTIDRLAGAVVIENGEHVFTVGIKKHVVIMSDGRIANRDGRTCPIVYQYNRRPAVMSLVRKRYFDFSDAA